MRDNVVRPTTIVFAFDVPLINLLRGLNLLGCNQHLLVAGQSDTSQLYEVPCITYSGSDDSAIISVLTDKVDHSSETVLILSGKHEIDTQRLTLIINRGFKKPRMYMHSCGPFENLKEAYKSQIPDAWVQVSSAPSVKPSKHPVPLYGIIGTRNEDDIIYACVRNAFDQGCQKVFLIDNQSTDKTKEEALEAGAELFVNYETDKYYEMLRIRLMNDAVEKVSLDSKNNKTWWLWMDADEFPRGPDNKTIAAFLAELPEEVRVVGAKVVNHFPTSLPCYKTRTHPGKLMPFGEPFDCNALKAKHCPLNHWKHPLHRFDRNASPIRALSGFHTANCPEKILESQRAITIHHFPFREKENTFRRYQDLCKPDNSSGTRITQNSSARIDFDDSVSIKKKSCSTRRYENLEFVYNGQWDKVCIAPGESPKVGVTLQKYEFPSSLKCKNN